MEQSKIGTGCKGSGEEIVRCFVSGETDKDVELAAQQLMLLSDEDSSSAGEHCGCKRKDYSLSNACAAKIIEEIFGREGGDDHGGEDAEGGEECELKQKRKKKYRLLEDIYRETKPVDSESYSYEEYLC